MKREDKKVNWAGNHAFKPQPMPVGTGFNPAKVSSYRQ